MFDKVKKIHDFLISLGFEYTQQEFDSVYRCKSGDLMLSHCVFNSDFTGLIDDDWENCEYTRADWDTKQLILFTDGDCDGVIVLTINPDGEVKISE